MKKPKNTDASADGSEEDQGGKENATPKEKPKANSAVKKTKPKTAAKKADTGKKAAEKPKAEGTRKSARVSAKRGTEGDVQEESTKKTKR